MKKLTSSKQDQKTPTLKQVITNIYGLTLGCLTTSGQSSMQSNIKQKLHIYSKQ